MIIGITGTIGSGKGAVTEYLKERGFVQYSSSALLGELVVKEGNPRVREFLSKMGTRLQAEYPGGVVEKNYREKFLVEEPKDAVFESLHRQSEADFLKGVGGIIIGIDADLKTRYERTSIRGETEKDQVSFEEFKEHSRIEDEGGGDETRDDNIREVINKADYVIMNNDTFDELRMQVEAILEKVSESDSR